MKLKLLFSAIFLVLFIGSSFGYTFNTDTDPSEFYEKTKPQNHADIAVGGNHLFGLTPKSEISISNFHSHFQTPDKNFLKFHLSISSIENLTLVQYNHFTVFYNNCLIASRKSDLIFPFHYFW